VPNDKSTYLETALVNLALRGIPFSGPVNVYVGLYTVMSSDRSVGGTEVSTVGTNYARRSITFDVPVYLGDGSAQVSNLVQVAFGTASSVWGSIVGFGLYDAASGGNLLYFGLLTVAQSVNTGDTIVFDPGSLTVSES
jgi:hypothetical protein